MAEIGAFPADVAAALAAYLAARTDDATWDAYLAGLGPGLALDVATELSESTESDADAAAWLAWCLYGDPPGPDEAADEDAARPLGIAPASRDIAAFLAASGNLDEVRITRTRAPLGEGRWRVRWDVTVSGEVGQVWEATGTATSDEAWFREIDSLERAAVVAPAVAACRALCSAWAPSWAATLAAGRRREA